MIYNIDGDARVNATITDQETVLVAIHHEGQAVTLEIEEYELSYMLDCVRRGDTGRIFMYNESLAKGTIKRTTKPIKTIDPREKRK